MAKLPDDYGARSVPAHIIELTSGPIGGLVLRWAFIENCVDVFMLYALDESEMAGKKIKWKTGFKAKAEFIKNMWYNSEKLRLSAPEIPTLMSDALRLSIMRDKVSHGVLMRFEETDGEMLLWFQRRDRGEPIVDMSGKTSMFVRNEAISIPDLLSVEDKFQELTVKLIDVTRRYVESQPC